jgi:hypothetical protein
MTRDELTANPGSQATTPRERDTRQEQCAQREAEQRLFAATTAAKHARREADAVARAEVDRLRARYFAERTTATDADFERELSSLIAGAREETHGVTP